MRKLSEIRRWLHPDQILGDDEFRKTWDAQALTGIKLLGITLVALSVVALILLKTLYNAENIKTEQGWTMSLRLMGLGALLLASLAVPVMRRYGRFVLLAVMFLLLADTLHLQLALFSIHRAQLGLFMAALCFIAFTFLPYRPWVIGLFGFLGLTGIVGYASLSGMGLHPYTDTGVFWFAAQFGALSLVTAFFRAAIMNMQVDMHLSRRRILSMQEDIEDIQAILSRAESDRLEFKSSFRYDYRLQQANVEISAGVLKSIAGFQNADGGALILGVDDSGKPLGLEKDYLTLKKKNADGFELSVIQAVTDAMGAAACRQLRFNFLLLEKKELCVLHIGPSPEPVYIEAKGQAQFYLRTGNSTQALDTRRAVEYIRGRWKSPTT